MTESEFFTDAEQLDWLEKQNILSNRDLIRLLEMFHRQLFHSVFIAPQTSEGRKEDNRRCNETIEDIATTLESRGALPPKFEAYALDPQELPWKPQILPTLSYKHSRN